MTGPAVTAAQCSPKTSVMSRSTPPPATGTSAYSVVLPSGSSTTPRIASAMARIVPRKPPAASAQVEDDGQPHADAPRSHAGRKRHALEAAHGLQGGLVQEFVRRRRGKHDGADRARRIDLQFDLRSADDAPAARRSRVRER